MSQMHPMITSQLAAENRRDTLARAERERLASQLAAMARASRRAGRAQRKMQKAVRLTLLLRSEPLRQPSAVTASRRSAWQRCRSVRPWRWTQSSDES
jgi:hypothetical protein